MNTIDKIDKQKSLFLINAMAIVVFGAVLVESIETIFCKQTGKITPLLSTSGLHFFLFGNLIVDWASANIKNYLEDGISFLMAFGIWFILLLEGYICILAFDYSNSISLLIFIGIIAFSVLYDMYFFCKTSSKIYGLFLMIRLSFASMLLVAFFCWRFTSNIGGVLSFIGAYIGLKIIRLVLLVRQEV